MEGWIKIHREIKSHWIWQNSEYLKWWVDLLLSAEYKDTETLIGAEVVYVKRGTVITSTRKLTEKWKASNSKVRTFLRLLEREKMIKRDTSTSSYTSIFIVNYEEYQSKTSTEKPKNQTLEYTTSVANVEKLKYGNTPFDKILESYNSICTRLPKIIDIAGERQAIVATRFKKYGLETVLKMFEKANSSDFLCGEGSKNFTATFDWLMKTDNFLKTLEGRYDNRTNGNKNIRNGNHISGNMQRSSVTENPNKQQYTYADMHLFLFGEEKPKDWIPQTEKQQESIRKRFFEKLTNEKI